MPANASDAELEERIIQHLAAAAAMGRARHIARREGHHHRSRTSAQNRPRYLGFSAQPSNVPSPTRPTSSDDVEPTVEAPTVPEEPPSSPLVPTIVPARPHESPSTDRYYTIHLITKYIYKLLEKRQKDMYVGPTPSDLHVKVTRFDPKPF